MNTISNAGFTVYKNNLSEKQIKQIKSDLYVTPFSSNKISKPKSFKVYIEYKEYFILPVHYTLNTFPELKYTTEFSFDTTVSALSLKKDTVLKQLQQDCFDNCIPEFDKDFGGGIINIGTGDGKTLMSVILACKLGVKGILILFNKIDFIEQWKKEIMKWTTKPLKFGLIQGSKFIYEDCDIVMGMIQTISMKKELQSVDFNWVNVAFIDEVDTLATEVFSQILYKVRPRFIFGLTATIERQDRLEKIIKWHLGDILYSNISGNLKQHTEIHVHNYFGESSKECYLYNGEKAFSKMLNNIAADQERTDKIVGILKELLKEPSRNILLLGDRLAQLRYIHSKLPKDSGLYIGKMNEDAKVVSREKRLILGTYKIADRGFNVPKLNCLVFSTPRKTITQAMGRIFRKHHEITPVIVDICDNFSIYKSQYNTRSKIYKKCIDKPRFVYDCTIDSSESDSDSVSSCIFD